MPKYLNLPGTSGSDASAPDTVGNSVTGSIDVRAKVSLNDWTPAATATIVAVRSSNSTTDTWQFRVETNGRIWFIWWDSGGTIRLPGTSSVATGFADGSINWVRATMDATNGNVVYYTSSDGSSWTQLGTTQSIGTATSIRNSSLPIRVGSMNGTSELMAGKTYSVEIRSGIGGTIVASPNFAAQALGATSFNDAQGNTWSINGSASIAGTNDSSLLLRRRRAS